MVTMLESRLVLLKQTDVFGDELTIEPSLRRFDQQSGMVLRDEPEVLGVAHTQSIPGGYGKRSTSLVFVK